MELKTIKEFAHKGNLGEGLKFESGLFQLDLDNEFNTIATALTDLNENKANKDDLSTLYKVKGSSTVADINVMTPEVGWVYNLTDSGTIINGLTGEVPVDAGDNVVYTDSGWDKLSAATKIALEAGDNISIEGNIISAIGYKYDKEKDSFSIGTGTATGEGSYAEGNKTTASGPYSRAEGVLTKAEGHASHAEGTSTKAGRTAHAEGGSTEATGNYSHSEGYQTKASGECSHAEGSISEALGSDSHAEGFRTMANNKYEHAQGCHNISNKNSDEFGDAGNTIHSIGIGSWTERKNAQEVMQNGDHYIIGIGGYDGTNVTDEEVKTLQETVNSKVDKEESKGLSTNDYTTEEKTKLEGIEEGAQVNTVVSVNGQVGEVVISELTAGTNVDITDNTISALGYEFDNELNSVKVGRKLTVEELEEIFGESAATLAAGNTSTLTAWENGTFSWAKDTNIIQVTDTSLSLPGVIFKVTTNDDSILCCIVDRDLPNNQLIVDKDIPFDYIENVSTLDTIIGIAYGKASIAGQATSASGNMAHSEGFGTFAHGMSSHSEGIMNWTLGDGSHAEGIGNVAYTTSAHAEGYITKAYGGGSHTEGGCTVAEGDYSHAEGFGTQTKHEGEHAEGKYNISNNISSDLGDEGNTIHSIGIGTNNDNRKNAFEIMQNGNAYLINIGSYNGTNPQNSQTLQEVITNTINSTYTKDEVNTLIEEVREDIDTILGPDAGVVSVNGQTGIVKLDIPTIDHLATKEELTSEVSTLNQKIDNLNIPTLPQNIVNTINGQTGDVVLPDTSTLATKEEVQAVNTRIDELNIPSDLSNVVTKTENYQVTLGTDNNPTHEKTLLVGTGLATSNNEALVVGAYNNSEYFVNWGVDAPAIQVGAGTEDSKRTVMVVQKNGKSLGLLGFEQNGFGDFAEYFEWADGNPEGEDRVGYMVQLNEDKIELAESLDNCIGIITGTGAFVADSACLDWHGRYLKDKWGRNIYELTGVLAENPDYDPTKEYIPREYRKEWSPVGLVGKVHVRQDGTLKPNGFVGCVNGIATNVDKSSWRVLKVINEEIALILIR